MEKSLFLTPFSRSKLTPLSLQANKKIHNFELSDFPGKLILFFSTNPSSKLQIKGSPFALNTLKPNPAAMELHDALADG